MMMICQVETLNGFSFFWGLKDPNGLFCSQKHVTCNGEDNWEVSGGRVHDHFTPALYNRLIQPCFMQCEVCKGLQWKEDFRYHVSQPGIFLVSRTNRRCASSSDTAVCPLCLTSLALAELKQSWGCSHLCWPKQPPAPSQLEQGPEHTLPAQPVGGSPRAVGGFAVCMALQLMEMSWKFPPPGNPRKTHCIGLLVSQRCLRWEKQLQAREGLCPDIPCYIHGTAAHQKAPSKKGCQLHDGKAGITALGHSACPLPISPTETCPASVSSHTLRIHIDKGKCVKIMSTHSPWC